jgi:RNA polymerase sigma-70 factor, ECF subfamily
VHTARHTTAAIHRRSNHTAQVPPVALAFQEVHSAAPRVIQCGPFSGVRETLLQFETFDEAYVARLRAGDPPTHAHFCSYFGRLIGIKLRSRLATRDDVEDVQQETFKRFFVALQGGRIEHPDRLGSFVNSMCNNVLREHYRGSKDVPAVADDDEAMNFPSPALDPLEGISIKQVQQLVRDTLEKLSERDRRILREVFLEERDKDDVCRDFGVSRDHLRLLLHRAKKAFREKYEKQCA